jgi:hypothetical protein
MVGKETTKKERGWKIGVLQHAGIERQNSVIVCEVVKPAAGDDGMGCLEWCVGQRLIGHMRRR